VSILIARPAYLIETTMISVQTSSETTPRIVPVSLPPVRSSTVLKV